MDGREQGDGDSGLIAVRRAEVAGRLAELEHRLVWIRSERGEWTDEEHDPEGFALVQEWSRAEGTRSEYLQELRELDLADARVDHGTFGVCESCGLPIPRLQLDRRPARTMCVTCTDARPRALR